MTFLDWDSLEKLLNNCQRCLLCEGRKNVVVGRGSKGARILLVGEGPGEQEDIQGLPFVGPAGKLLDSLLAALSFNPQDYYITNIVKCRPPGNRVPTDAEAHSCLPFLREQFKLIRPLITVCMGSVASKYLIDPDIRITKARGVWAEKKGCYFMPTFHPAALLRDPSKKIDMYNDMKEVRDRLLNLTSRNPSDNGEK
jgi:DNA polymerase